jgi:hypothetical protein
MSGIMDETIIEKQNVTRVNFYMIAVLFGIIFGCHQELRV